MDGLDLGFLGYGLAALLFLLFSLLLLTSWRGRLQGGLLVLIALVSALWAGLSAAQSGQFLDSGYLPWALEGLRALLLWVFLIRLLERLAEGKTRRGQLLKRLRYAAAALGLLLMMPLETPGLLVPVEGEAESATLGLRLVLQVLVAVGGLALVEQVYRNTPWEHRWGIKYLCLGMGMLFAFDFYLYSDALLFHRLDPGIWEARGAVNALAVPLLGVSAARNPQWSLDVFVSRKIVFHTTALFAAGVYLLAMALTGYYIRLYGGEWSRVLQILFLVGAGVVLLVLLFSGQFRARMRVLITKHFFSYKFDYREEWLRLIGILSDRALRAPLAERVIHAIGEMVDSPGGALWLCAAPNECRYQAFWNMPDELFRGERPLGSLPGYLRATGWVVNLDEYLRDPELYEGLELPDWLFASGRLWLIVPLIHEGDLLGFTLLARPRAPHRMDWESLDLLKTAGKQSASYLALERAATALAEARQFEGFNRLSAFVMHDLKNLIAQLSLVAKNAERHRHNPAFIEDALKTVGHAVERMNRLMGQLRGAMPGSRADRINLADLLRRVVAERATQAPVPGLVAPEDEAVVYADRERLAAVIGHVVQNAQEAAAGGRVEVRLGLQGPEARIEVEDDGVGMDADFVRNRLFKPFDSTKGLTGMGIGAYECREFVHGLGGRVSVQSEPGTGTLFAIHLPLAKEIDS